MFLALVLVSVAFVALALFKFRSSRTAHVPGMVPAGGLPFLASEEAVGGGGARHPEPPASTPPNRRADGPVLDDLTADVRGLGLTSQAPDLLDSDALDEAPIADLLAYALDMRGDEDVTIAVLARTLSDARELLYNGDNLSRDQATDRKLRVFRGLRIAIELHSRQITSLHEAVRP